MQTLSAQSNPNSQIKYPKDPELNVRFRAELIQRADKNPAVAKEIIKTCREDILFWINVFCWTKDTRVQNSPTLPFVTYEFQDKYILDIQAAILGGYDILTEKSRDMGATWCVMYVLQWFFQFKSGADFRVGSRKEA